MGYSHAVTGPRAYRPRYLPVDEEHGALPHETYGLSKLVGEQVLEAAARTAIEASFVSLRFTNIVKRELWGTLPWPAPDDASPLTLLLWAYCHEDDVIAAHVAAATMDEAAAPGTHEPYIIAAPDTRFREPTLPLMASHLGLHHVPLAAPLAGNASVLSARKAERRLGLAFRSWQTEADDESRPSVAAPALVDAGGGRGSPAARRARADRLLRHFDLGGFVLESGEVLPKGATLAYRVHGPAPGAAPKGVILHPTSFDAVHDELAYQIGDGRALDTSQYTVIVPNLMGNGVSFSPSLEERPGGGAPPPLLTVSDNVRAQRLMLRALGVGCDAESPLELVYGYSMGGLQAYEWAVAYPEAVRRVAVVCGASRCSEINAVFLRSLEAALQADGAWDEEARRFVRHPSRGLRAFGAIYAGWGVGTEWYEGRRGESAGGAAMGGNRSTPNAAAGYASADDFVDRSYLPAFAQCDGDDLLSQIRTWRHADVARHAALGEAVGGGVGGGGGDRPSDEDAAAALRRVRARVLLMPCDTDKYFTVEEARREAAALGERAILAPIRSAAGHRAGDPHRPELADELAFIRARVHALLQEQDV